MSFGLRQRLVPALAPRFRGQGLIRWIGAAVVACSSWSVIGEFPNLSKLVVIAAPHSSNWDGIIGLSITHALGVRATWMGKNSLFRFGLDRLLRGLGGIATDRSNAHGAVGQMVEMFRQPQPLWLFLAPEGTRKGVPKWRTGFWHIASEAGVPILLVAIDFPARRFVIGPLFLPSGDKERDLQALYDYYRPFHGKYGKSGLPFSEQGIKSTDTR